MRENGTFAFKRPIAVRLKYSVMRYSFFWMLWYVASGALMAQPVSFTQNDDKLRFVTGTMGQARCAADMNGDGLDDITRVSSEGVYMDYQQPNGSFLHQFFPIDLQVLPNWSICAGDIDNNGLNDLLFGGGSHVSFLKAQDGGTGYIESVMPDFIFSQRSTFFDIDADGDLDAFVCRDDGQSQTFRNNGTGNMSLDQALLNTSALPGSYSAIWTDYNNDGHTDLYITKCLATGLPGNPARTNLLYKNNGDGTFTEQGATAGLDDNAQSWSTVFEDFDNDGDFDAFIVNHDQGNRLFRNNDDGTFTNVIAGSGIDELDLGAWENAAGDFNNDGYVDIFSELVQRLYLGNGDLSFDAQSLPFTPGAIGDFNNDGFLDVTYRNQLWLNDRNDHHWLKVQLRGIESNRNGIGARIEIYGPWGIQIRELRAGQSFSPMNSLCVHFGLGQADSIDKLVVRWPGGMVTEMPGLVADSTYLIPEAPCVLTPGNIATTGKTELCIGDSSLCIAPPGYAWYLWSNGAGTAGQAIHNPGLYTVVCVDSSGCAGVTPIIEIRRADAVAPDITIVGGESRVCHGTPVALISSAGDASFWSNGIQDTGMVWVYDSGIFTVAKDSVCGTGQLVSAPVEIEFLPAPAPQIESVTLMPGDSVLLEAIGENCVWFDVDTGGNALSDTCAFQTGPVFSDTVLFVESRFVYPRQIQTGGKPDSLGFGGSVASGKAMQFSTWAPFTLVSTDMYLSSQMPEGERVIRLVSDTGTIAQTSVFLHQGKNVVSLQFHVPVGRFSLTCDQSTQFLNIGALDYPYPLGDVGRLDSSSTGLNFYPYFYNWIIQKEAITCTSPRTPVHILTSAAPVPSEDEGIRVYPVPATAMLHIILTESIPSGAVMQVADITGQTRLQQAVMPGNEQILDTSGLAPGSYRLTVLAPSLVVSRLLIIAK
jgi:hypothetical protein